MTNRSRAKKWVLPRASTSKALAPNAKRESRDARQSEAAKKPVTGNSPTSCDSNPIKGWSATRLREEATGKLFIEFRFPDGEGGESLKVVPNGLTPSQICQELRNFTTELPKERRTAYQFVERLMTAAPARSLIKASRAGWKWATSETLKTPEAFVTPNSVLPPTAPYRVCDLTNSLLGKQKGSLESWKECVVSFARHSNYLTFGLCCAAAGPLLRFSGLSESAVFNFVGESSVGKTTVVKVAMSAIAPPDAIEGWDQKNRALEEAAAAHNDLLLVLNGAEQIPQRERVVLIERIIHMLPEGKATGRSMIVQDVLPNKVWKSIVLSTSNAKGSEMTASKRQWCEQDSVRFIDIPVPRIENSGIFDQESARSAGDSSDLVAELEANLSDNFGTFLPRWIEYLMERDRTDRLSHWSSRYLKIAKPAPGMEQRIAKKFALVYAAGKIATEAGLFPFEERQVLRAVRAMHRGSIDLRAEPSEALRRVLGSIASELDDHGIFRQVFGDCEINIDSPGELLGVKGQKGGRGFVGFRLESLEFKYGKVLTQAVVSWLRQKRLLFEGKGGKPTVQLRFTLVVRGKRLSKPRFLITYEEELRKALSLCMKN